MEANYSQETCKDELDNLKRQLEQARRTISNMMEKKKRRSTTD